MEQESISTLGEPDQLKETEKGDEGEARSDVVKETVTAEGDGSKESASESVVCSMDEKGDEGQPSSDVIKETVTAEGDGSKASVGESVVCSMEEVEKMEEGEQLLKSDVGKEISGVEEKDSEMTESTAVGLDEESKFKSVVDRIQHITAEGVASDPPNIPVNLSDLDTVQSPDEGLTHEFFISVIEDLSQNKVSSGRLVVSKLHGLLLSGSRQVKVPFKCVRWFKKMEHIQLHNGCLILSYEDAETSAISFIFFICNELDKQMIEKILIWKLSESPDASALKTKGDRDKVLYLLQQEPSEIGKMMTIVKPKDASNMNGNAASEAIMIFDLECISFFQGWTAKPAHQIKFWINEGEDVVETIKVVQAEAKIDIETSTKIVTMLNVGMSVTNHLKKMKARDKHFFLNIETLLKIAAHSEPPPRYNEEPRQSTQSWQTSTRPSSGQQFAATAMSGFIESLKIEREMEDAINSLGQVEEFQLQWIVMETELEQLLSIGAVQETEIQSGGLDPDNADHLERALIDAADQLKDERMDLALSRIQATRKLFATSKRSEIKQIFVYNDMEILKRLYYRSLME